MFEVLNSFFGGVVASAAGGLTLWAVWQAASKHKRKIYFDIFSASPIVSNIPEEFSLSFARGDKNFDRVFSTYIVIKNETEEAIDSGNILQEFGIRTSGEFDLISQSVIETGESSTGRISHNRRDSLLNLEDVLIPVDGALLLKVVSNAPVFDNLLGVHKNHRIERRDYRAIRFQWLPLTIFIFVPLIIAWGLIDSLGDGTKGLVTEIVSLISQLTGAQPSIGISVAITMVVYLVAALILSHLVRRFFKLSKGEEKYRKLISLDPFAALKFQS